MMPNGNGLKQLAVRCQRDERGVALLIVLLSTLLLTALALSLVLVSSS